MFFVKNLELYLQSFLHYIVDNFTLLATLSSIKYLFDTLEEGFILIVLSVMTLSEDKLINLGTK